MMVVSQVTGKSSSVILDSSAFLHFPDPFGACLVCRIRQFSRKSASNPVPPFRFSTNTRARPFPSYLLSLSCPTLCSFLLLHSNLGRDYEEQLQECMASNERPKVLLQPRLARHAKPRKPLSSSPTRDRTHFLLIQARGTKGPDRARPHNDTTDFESGTVYSMELQEGGLVAYLRIAGGRGCEEQTGCLCVSPHRRCRDFRIRWSVKSSEGCRDSARRAERGAKATKPSIARRRPFVDRARPSCTSQSLLDLESSHVVSHTVSPPSSASSSTPSKVASWVWERELKLVERMLDLDSRNFHGWDCRRAIIQHLAYTVLSSHPSTTSLVDSQASFPALLSESILQEAEVANVKKDLLALADRELAYALRKIESNFSNFSAWHQRTKLLPPLWAARQLSQKQLDTQLDAELELVKQAMYTDPSDQSVWFYHRWLVDQLLQSEGDKERKIRVLQEEVEGIEELFELEPESKWCAMALAHLQTLLGELIGDKAKAEDLKGKVKGLLEKLIELDSDRKARYEDLLEGKAQF